jgi:heat shock protein HtpX
MLLGTVIVILVGVVAMLSDLFLRVSFWGGGGRRKQSSGGSAGIIILVLGIAAAILTPIVATLIRLAVSRKREFLADATGVLLTRYPEGLARALEKISKDQAPLKAANNSTSHLYISSPSKGDNAKNWLTKLYMTHPPVEERIRILREMG